MTFGKSDVRVAARPDTLEGEPSLTILDYTTPHDRAAHELWRRMRCNQCTMQYAAQHAAQPADLNGARGLDCRQYTMNGAIQCTTHDERWIWLANDTHVQQIDIARKSSIASYGSAQGLPDLWIGQRWRHALDRATRQRQRAIHRRWSGPA